MPSDAERMERRLQAAHSLLATAAGEGWLPPAAAGTLEALGQEARRMEADAVAGKPVIVGFFGGTGVGKSSLLNRLAGAEVARTGVVRPTSHEVSIYLHHSVQLSRLPADLPTEAVRVAFHRNDAGREILWIDTPDFDSTEHANRELTLRWLPHMDIVIYVVSPERYRDSRGWRWLLEQKQRHLWLFVMNQWDRGGDPRQLADFGALLHSAGFEDPAIYHTDCRSPERRAPDQFEELRRAVESLVAARAHEQLHLRRRHTLQARLGEMLRECAAALGDERAGAALRDGWRQIWADTASGLHAAMAARLRAQAIRALIDQELGRQEPLAGANWSWLWDEWADSLAGDAVEDLIIEAAVAGLPQTPLRQALQGVQKEFPGIVTMQARRQLHAALSQPGHRIQRLGYRLSGALALLLPLLASGWVGYETVVAYYLSTETHNGYLGSAFVWHSALLVAIAWALPYFLHRALRPSLERAARRALERSVDLALAHIAERVAEPLEAVLERRRQLRRELDLLAHAVETDSTQPFAPVPAKLARYLPVNQ